MACPRYAIYSMYMYNIHVLTIRTYTIIIIIFSVCTLYSVRAVSAFRLGRTSRSDTLFEPRTVRSLDIPRKCPRPFPAGKGGWDPSLSSLRALSLTLDDPGPASLVRYDATLRPRQTLDL